MAKLGDDIDIDIAKLVESRMLIQANSGGGKSWAIRRLLEQTYGDVQQIVIDHDGEFHTLREKYDYVLAGKGGDCPADIKSAAMLARRLLELRVSAIIDIYELGTQRAEFVKRFLDSLVNAPRELWHPVLIVVDEAHIYCLDEETEILTFDGWKRHDQLTEGFDRAVAFDLPNGEYRYETISKVHRKQHNGEMIALKSDGIDCVVTPEHRVVMRRQQRAPGRYGRFYDWTFSRADEVPTHAYIPTGGAPFGSGLDAPAHLVSEDLMRLIGWVATDGCFAGGGERYLSISQSYKTTKCGKSMVKELEALLEHLGGKSRYERPERRNSGKTTSPSVDFYLGAELSETVRAWMGKEIHRIPRKLIVEGTRAQLEALLQGLLEGDGTGKEDWTTFYPGHNEGLADDFQEIALRLGYSVSKKRTAHKPNPQWSVNISRRPHHYIRKPSKTTYKGLVWCVTVPSGAFVARRNGKVFVTGNCPEAGSSVSADAVKSLMTLGRKRGFCGVLATQRISKLHKDAAAEANNKLIGRSSLDIDMRRASDELGFNHTSDRLKLRELKPGEFFAFGPAIADVVTKFHVGPVKTTHLRAGQRSVSVAVPSAKIKKVLGQLADLPHEAEEEARSLTDAKARIRQLEAELRKAPKAVEPKIKTVEKPVIKDAQLKRILTLIENVDNLVFRVGAIVGKLGTLGTDLRNAAAPIKAPPIDQAANRRAEAALSRYIDKQPTRKLLPTKEGSSDLGRAERAILTALAELEALGQPTPEDAAVAFVARYSPTSGHFANVKGRLRSAGLVEYPDSGLMKLTNAGRDAVGTVSAPPSLEELHERVMSILKGPQRKMLKPLLDCYPDALDLSTWAERSGFSETSGHFANMRGRLHTLGVVEYPQNGLTCAAKVLFPDGL